MLGQKRSLYQLPGARTPGVIQKDEVLNYLGDTVGRVLGVRTLFKNQFEQAVQTTERIARSCGGHGTPEGGDDAQYPVLGYV